MTNRMRIVDGKVSVMSYAYACLIDPDNDAQLNMAAAIYQYFKTASAIGQ